MKIAVIGVGHVGLVNSACFADLGHDVVGFDVDRAKIGRLLAGEVPFYEPDLAALTARGVEAGTLRFTDDPSDALGDVDVVFICVGTPPRADGGPDLTYVPAAATTVATYARRPVVVAEKSTVPVQTGVRIRETLALHARASGHDRAHQVVSNPEFLREGSAVADTLYPDRIVVGADDAEAQARMREVYAPMLARHECPYVATDVRTAELIKHASNAFLATKISFINAVARICEVTGADVETLADAMGHDARIGRSFLNAGLGYGGSCFPKDVSAFIHIAAQLGYDFGLLRETERINREARMWPLQQLHRLLWNVRDRSVAVLGVAFKPDTDDIRESPAVDLVEALVADGASVRLHDPVALDHVRERFPTVTFAESAEDALAGAHAAVVCTEWDEYRKIEPRRLAELLTYPVVVDARNVFDPQAMADAGLISVAVGRPAVTAP